MSKLTCLSGSKKKTDDRYIYYPYSETGTVMTSFITEDEYDRELVSRLWSYQKMRDEAVRHILKRTSLIIATENPFISPDWIEAKRKEWGETSPAFDAYINGDWGVDLAHGKDRSVTVRIPEEEN